MVASPSGALALCPPLSPNHECTGQTWSTLLRAWNLEDPESLGPPRRWKFLITVVNCGNAPRIRNPPSSVDELQARLRSALGIETEELANEAIVTGFDGPQRRPLETDEDLQEFWKSVAADVEIINATPEKQGGRRMSLMGGTRKEEAVTNQWQLELEQYRQDVEIEIDGYKSHIDRLQKQNLENEQRIGELTTDNLDFISRFEAKLKEKETKVWKELQSRFHGLLEGQAQQILDVTSRLERTENTVHIREQTIREQESEIRELRGEVQRLEVSVQKERAHVEKLRRNLASEIDLKREALHEAGAWRHKYEKVLEDDSRRDPEALDFRIMNITRKIGYFAKGRMIQSPEFEVAGLGPIQFEFFPNGDLNAQDGWCSFKMRVPDCTTLRWSAYIGRRKIGPRIDNFEQRQWWNKYGLVMLNFCSLAELRREISAQTDSIVCGVEIEPSGPIPGDADWIVPSVPQAPSALPNGAGAETPDDDGMSIGERLCALRHTRAGQAQRPLALANMRPTTAPAGQRQDAGMRSHGAMGITPLLSKQLQQPGPGPRKRQQLNRPPSASATLGRWVPGALPANPKMQRSASVSALSRSNRRL